MDGPFEHDTKIKRSWLEEISLFCSNEKINGTLERRQPESFSLCLCANPTCQVTSDIRSKNINSNYLKEIYEKPNWALLYTTWSKNSLNNKLNNNDLFENLFPKLGDLQRDPKSSSNFTISISGTNYLMNDENDEDLEEDILFWKSLCEKKHTMDNTQFINHKHEPQNMVENVVENTVEKIAENIVENMGENMEEITVENVAENMVENIGENMIENIAENIGENMIENIAENMGENTDAACLEDDLFFSIDEPIGGRSETKEVMGDSAMLSNGDGYIHWEDELFGLATGSGFSTNNKRNIAENEDIRTLPEDSDDYVKSHLHSDTIISINDKNNEKNIKSDENNMIEKDLNISKQDIQNNNIENNISTDDQCLRQQLIYNVDTTLSLGITKYVPGNTLHVLSTAMENSYNVCTWGMPLPTNLDQTALLSAGTSTTQDMNYFLIIDSPAFYCYIDDLFLSLVTGYESLGKSIDISNYVYFPSACDQLDDKILDSERLLTAFFDQDIDITNFINSIDKTPHHVLFTSRMVKIFNIYALTQIVALRKMHAADALSREAFEERRLEILARREVSIRNHFLRSRLLRNRLLRKLLYPELDEKTSDIFKKLRENSLQIDAQIDHKQRLRYCAVRCLNLLVNPPNRNINTSALLLDFMDETLINGLGNKFLVAASTSGGGTEGDLILQEQELFTELLDVMGGEDDDDDDDIEDDGQEMSFINDNESNNEIGQNKIDNMKGGNLKKSGNRRRRKYLKNKLLKMNKEKRLALVAMGLNPLQKGIESITSATQQAGRNPILRIPRTEYTIVLEYFKQLNEQNSVSLLNHSFDDDYIRRSPHESSKILYAGFARLPKNTISGDHLNGTNQNGELTNSELGLQDGDNRVISTSKIISTPQGTTNISVGGLTGLPLLTHTQTAYYLYGSYTCTTANARKLFSRFHRPDFRLGLVQAMSYAQYENKNESHLEWSTWHVKVPTNCVLIHRFRDDLQLEAGMRHIRNSVEDTVTSILPNEVTPISNDSARYFIEPTDLSLSDTGPIAITEYLEQYPAILSNPGMASRLIKYHIKNYSLQALNEKHGVLGTPIMSSDGAVNIFLAKLKLSPDNHDSALVIENNMYKALAAFQKQSQPNCQLINSNLEINCYGCPSLFKDANTGQHLPTNFNKYHNPIFTDFLLVRKPIPHTGECTVTLRPIHTSYSETDENQNALENFCAIYTVGQLDPTVLIPSTDSKRYCSLKREVCRVLALRLSADLGINDEKGVSEYLLKRFCPPLTHKEVIFLIKNITGQKQLGKIPLIEEHAIRKLLGPETLCLLESAQAADHRIKNSGIMLLKTPDKLHGLASLMESSERSLRTSWNSSMKKKRDLERLLDRSLSEPSSGSRPVSAVSSSQTMGVLPVHKLSEMLGSASNSQEAPSTLVRYIELTLNDAPWQKSRERNNVMLAHANGQFDLPDDTAACWVPMHRRVAENKSVFSLCKDNEQKEGGIMSSADSQPIRSTASNVGMNNSSNKELYSGTDKAEDLRKLSMEELRARLISYGVSSSTVSSLPRWDQVALVRKYREDSYNLSHIGLRGSSTIDPGEYEKRMNIILHNQIDMLHEEGQCEDCEKINEKPATFSLTTNFIEDNKCIDTLSREKNDKSEAALAQKLQDMHELEDFKKKLGKKTITNNLTNNTHSLDSTSLDVNPVPCIRWLRRKRTGTTSPFSSEHVVYIFGQENITKFFAWRNARRRTSSMSSTTAFPQTNAKRFCGLCGEQGHIASNPVCPLFPGSRGGRTSSNVGDNNTQYTKTSVIDGGDIPTGNNINNKKAKKKSYPKTDPLKTYTIPTNCTQKNQHEQTDYNLEGYQVVPPLPMEFFHEQLSQMDTTGINKSDYADSGITNFNNVEENLSLLSEGFSELADSSLGRQNGVPHNIKKSLKRQRKEEKNPEQKNKRRINTHSKTNALLSKEKAIYELNLTFRRVVNFALANKTFHPFRNKVEESQAINYYKLVEEPMWLTLISDKAKEGFYRDRSQFKNDVALIVKNCKIYNIGHSPSAWLRDVADQLQAVLLEKLEEHSAVLDEYEQIIINN